MPAYDALSYDPPAPVAFVEWRNPETGRTIANVPMLIDTGADVTLVPEAIASQLLAIPNSELRYELVGFGGAINEIQAVRLELKWLRRTFRGLYLPVSQPWGILGRNVLNATPILLNGPALIWEEWRR